MIARFVFLLTFYYIQFICADHVIIDFPVLHPMPSHECMNRFPVREKRNEIFSSDQKICIISSLFVNHLNQSDHMATLKKIDDPAFQYFLFTNHKQVVSSWPVYVIKHLPYKYLVTQSRFPKFLAWMLPETRACRVFFYSDALYVPSNDKQRWLNVSARLLQGNVGFMQRYIHRDYTIPNQPCGKFAVGACRDGLLAELDYAIELKKDSPHKLKITKEWISSNSFFKGNKYTPNNYQTFINAVFGYDPDNMKFRQIVCEFWAVYSVEILTWRDQGIWSLTMARNNVTYPDFWEPMWSLKGKPGFNSHTYTDIKHD